MLDLLQQRLKAVNTQEEKYNLLREYLQLLILQLVDEKGFFRHLAFVGGTALRILFDLNRFSEDLDFCLVEPKNYQFSTLMQMLEKELNLQGLKVNIHYKDHKNVASAFIKFDALLFELGFSPHRDQKLSIKFEVDQNTPAGFKTAFTLLTRDLMIGINHFDLPSLFAGKLHALLCRKYTKGRDYYDFLWYVGRKIKPNYPLLEQSILQTEKKSLALDPTLLSEILLDRFRHTDFNRVIEDLHPFIIDQKELRFFTQEVFAGLARGLIE